MSLSKITTGQATPIMAPSTNSTLSEASWEDSSSALPAHTTWSPAERKFTRRVTLAPESPNSSSAVSVLENPLLPALWMGDVLVAMAVTAAVAPTLTIVDKAIVEQSARAGERGVLVQSMQRTAASILSNPAGYYRSPTFGWMWLTYAATYTTANIMKTWNEQSSVAADRNHTYSSSMPSSKKKASSGGVYLVAGTTLVNSGASLVKDRAYARMFGTSPKPVPAASYAAWMMRDGLVIGSGFVLPAYVAPVVQETLGCSSTTAATLSQLLTPVAAQVIAGPLHLAGLTLYNATVEQTWHQKVAAWRQGLATVTAARMLRILPGYGIAGVVNQKGRVAWKDHLLQSQIRRGDHKQSAWAMVTLIRSAAVSGGK